MNVHDSERMAEALENAGYSQTSHADGADLIVLNTCHIREKATEKVYSELGRFKRRKAEKPGLKIAVAGCVAQAEGEEILRRQPLVDIVVGPQAYHRLPKMIEDSGAGDKLVDIDFPQEDKFDFLPKSKTPRSRPSAYLTIQEGCDKFCTFCVVPYTRGAETSRPSDRVIEDARRLVNGGAKEITLLGQNVNAYHGIGPDGRQWGLARLIRGLADIEGLHRIRYTTSHPSDMTEELIEAHGECPKLMPYLHLPVQSGSDRVLKAMNRRHTTGDYIRVIERIRASRPDIIISGDFIVGFPGETEEDFQYTLALVRKVRYGHAFSFKYSPRPGTPAATGDQVDPDEASERLQRLQELLKFQQRAAMDEFVGRSVSVLFEKKWQTRGPTLWKIRIFAHGAFAMRSEFQR